jgi:hypothetical protein
LVQDSCRWGKDQEKEILVDECWWWWLLMLMLSNLVGWGLRGSDSLSRTGAKEVNERDKYRLLLLDVRLLISCWVVDMVVVRVTQKSVEQIWWLREKQLEESLLNRQMWGILAPREMQLRLFCWPEDEKRY